MCEIFRHIFLQFYQNNWANTALSQSFLVAVAFLAVSRRSSWCIILPDTANVVQIGQCLLIIKNKTGDLSHSETENYFEWKVIFSLLETDLSHYNIKKLGFPKKKFCQFFLWLVLEEHEFNWNNLYLGKIIFIQLKHSMLLVSAHTSYCSKDAGQGLREAVLFQLILSKHCFCIITACTIRGTKKVSNCNVYKNVCHY